MAAHHALRRRIVQDISDNPFRNEAGESALLHSKW